MAPVFFISYIESFFSERFIGLLRGELKESQIEVIETEFGRSYYTAEFDDNAFTSGFCIQDDLAENNMSDFGRVVQELLEGMKATLLEKYKPPCYVYIHLRPVSHSIGNGVTRFTVRMNIFEHMELGVQSRDEYVSALYQIKRIVLREFNGQGIEVVTSKDDLKVSNSVMNVIAVYGETHIIVDLDLKEMLAFLDNPETLVLNRDYTALARKVKGLCAKEVFLEWNDLIDRNKHYERINYNMKEIKRTQIRLHVETRVVAHIVVERDFGNVTQYNKDFVC